MCEHTQEMIEAVIGIMANPRKGPVQAISVEEGETGIFVVRDASQVVAPPPPSAPPKPRKRGLGSPSYARGEIMFLPPDFVERHG